ncbi:hypothetical protein ACJIZ3_018487 [Penstemon smallii]|uniref:EGF-like domain-containing protein n=1 Tax=Penstemon smallii TaxID=265156 RepID=A0ABD3SYL2_9LAMI
MGNKWALGQFYSSLCLIFFIHVHICDSQEQAFNTFTISSLTYARTFLKPYDWRYITVELPPWFSSMSFALDSDVDIDLSKLKNGLDNSLPMICFREGSLPLPDVYNTSLTGLGKKKKSVIEFIISISLQIKRYFRLIICFTVTHERYDFAVLDYISNDSFVGTQNLQNIYKCYPLQNNILLRLTNEQISPGTWYFGLFNGIGPIRTQSKMINRGSAYFFSGNITVEGCTTSTMWGPFCNQTVNMLTCNERKNVEKNVYSCKNANGIVCHEDDGPRMYSLDVLEVGEELIIKASNVTFNQTQRRNNTLMSYARLGALPLKTVYDYSGDISKAPLVIPFPKAGRWYIAVQQIDISNKSEEFQNNGFRACYLLESQVLQCPGDKAGLNCMSEKYILQAFLRKNPSVPFESNYMPISEKVSSEISPSSTNFPLEPLLSNVSSRNNDDSWVFFLMEIPLSATGGNIHVHLSSDSKINYEIYARYGGLPSLNSWDYYYANSTNNSNGSMFFKLYDSSEDSISFYLLYVQGGTWCFGLRKLNGSISTTQTAVSLSLERCPRKCSSHGTCQSALDTSGLTLYSYCACDRNHGGVDCSIELVSHRGHIQQSIFLIASNAAAVLPAYWALRNKAFSEWVLFTSSGISSGLYHACDVGTWCVMSFHVLQFLDFWLSFMAVVSTFVHLTSLSEASKRTIHTIVAILTALMAETGPTRSSNISYVIGIGTVGLLVGWLIEFSTHYRSFSLSTEFHLNLLDRWETTKGWIRNIIKTIKKRFRWGFILAGFAALAMAAISWKLESTESYWICHSIWHISIYTSSFFFLCSRAEVSTCENDRSYELTRQNSFGGPERTQL